LRLAGLRIIGSGQSGEGVSVKRKDLELPFWIGLLLCAVLLALLAAAPTALAVRVHPWAGFAAAVAAIPAWRYLGPPPGPGFLTGLVCVSGLLGLVGLAILLLVRAVGA